MVIRSKRSSNTNVYASDFIPMDYQLYDIHHNMIAMYR